MGIVGMFPKSWRSDATVVRSGGRDSKGNPLPDTELPITDVLIAPRATNDPLDRSDVLTSENVVYHNSFVFLPTDKLRIPAGNRMAGLWRVDGRTEEWPMGTVTSVVLA